MEQFTNKKQIKTLLVDLDGTLLGAYDLIVHIRFIRKTLWRLRKRAGWMNAMKILNVLALVAKSPVKMAHILQNPDKLTNAEKASNAVSSVLKMPIEQSEKMLNEVLTGVFPTLSKFFYPMPGAADFILWASGKYPIVLATNPVWPQEIIEMRVKWAGIDPGIFKSITHAKRMNASKPEPLYYEQILSQEGLKPEECILIGNDMKNDLSAVKVGIPVYIVTKKGSGLKSINVKPGEAQAMSGDFDSLKKILL